MPLLMQTGKPRAILGLMTFGPDASAGARVTSLDEYNKCLDYFQSQGYNEVDTARTYIGGGILPRCLLRCRIWLIGKQASKKPSHQRHAGKREA